MCALLLWQGLKASVCLKPSGIRESGGDSLTNECNAVRPCNVMADGELDDEWRAYPWKKRDPFSLIVWLHQARVVVRPKHMRRALASSCNIVPRLSSAVRRPRLFLPWNDLTALEKKRRYGLQISTNCRNSLADSTSRMWKKPRSWVITASSQKQVGMSSNLAQG